MGAHDEAELRCEYSLLYHTYIGSSTWNTCSSFTCTGAVVFYNLISITNCFFNMLLHGPTEMDGPRWRGSVSDFTTKTKKKHGTT